MTTNKDAASSHSSKLITTSAACFASAFITYPAEMYRLSFFNKVLATWDFQNAHNKSNDLSRELLTSNNQKLRVIISPLLRLVSHEVAMTTTTTMLTINTIDTVEGTKSSIFNEIVAGIISGTCQALMLCPLEARRANQLMDVEEKHFKSWKNWAHGQIFDGGTSDPLERRTRAYHGVGILAAREIIFNVTFFPLFTGYHKVLNSITANYFDKSDCILSCDESDTLNIFASGILAGVTCSLAVTPMDIMKTYYMYSREQWSLWSGKRVFAPPKNLLLRGLTLQALVFGPTFGIVAAIYKLA